MIRSPGSAAPAGSEQPCGVVMAAVQQYGWALEHASEKLQNDREVVLAVVRQNGWAKIKSKNLFLN